MKVYGLIGKKLEHSFSKAYFEEKFEKLNIRDAEYRNFEFDDPTRIREILSLIPGISGLNVTIPFKTAIIAQLDELDKDAGEIGAVNTIRIAGNRWVGYNTDVYGFSTSLKPFLTNLHTRALVLGTGGAAKAVIHSLNKLNIAVVRVSRTSGKGDLTYGELNAYVMQACKLIINTTPLGMWPDTGGFPEIPYEHLSPEHLVYDLVYNPAETAFLKKAKNRGAAIINGMNMLKFQAEKSWEIWNS